MLTGLLGAEPADQALHELYNPPARVCHGRRPVRRVRAVDSVLDLHVHGVQPRLSCRDPGQFSVLGAVSGPRHLPQLSDPRWPKQVRFVAAGTVQAFWQSGLARFELALVISGVAGIVTGTKILLLIPR